MIVETRKIPKDHRRRGENRGSKTQAMRGGVKWEDLGKPLIENGEDKWYRGRRRKEGQTTLKMLFRQHLSKGNSSYSVKDNIY